MGQDTKVTDSSHIPLHHGGFAHYSRLRRDATSLRVYNTVARLRALKYSRLPYEYIRKLPFHLKYHFVCAESIHLTSPHLTSPHLTTPHHTSPIPSTPKKIKPIQSPRNFHSKPQTPPSPSPSPSKTSPPPPSHRTSPPSHHHHQQGEETCNNSPKQDEKSTHHMCFSK